MTMPQDPISSNGIGGGGGDDGGLATADNNGNNDPSVVEESSYYSSGCAELATESALLLDKLARRLELTRGDERLVIVLVGLPGRGKSFIARKLQNFLQWTGNDCSIFNVGRYRRRVEEGHKAGAEFFDPKNASAAALRQEVARLCLHDMLDWIDEPFESIGGGVGGGGASSSSSAPKSRVGIFDATNSTKERRDWVLRECNDPVKRAGKPTGVVFVESVCDDDDLMRENFHTKVITSPDYDGVPIEEAMADIMERSKKYEEAYETIDDDDVSYVKIFNLSSKILVNHVYGMLAKTVVPALMSWNIGTRPVYLCRPAATASSGTLSNGGGHASLLGVAPQRTTKAQRRQTLVRSKSAFLDKVGEDFRDALFEFTRKECTEFAERRKKEIAGGRRKKRGSLTDSIGLFAAAANDVDCPKDEMFPCHIVTSTTPRARETVAWKCMPSQALSNFNDLDKGEFNGLSMEQIEKKDPQWYSEYQNDPFYTRFPGGECQADLMLRLEPMAISIEQQTDPVLIVTHTSVLQALVAYFRNSDAEACVDIDLPLNTVFKFTPVKGGGWLETRHCILGEGSSGGGAAEKLGAISE